MIIYIKAELPAEYLQLAKETPKVPVSEERQMELWMENFIAAGSCDIDSEKPPRQKDTPKNKEVIKDITTENLEVLRNIPKEDQHCDFCSREVTAFLITEDAITHFCCDVCYQVNSFVCSWCSKTFLPSAYSYRLTEYLGTKPITYDVCSHCYEKESFRCAKCLKETSPESRPLAGFTSEGGLCSECEKDYKNAYKNS
jgi:hypothetical protein